MSKSAYLRDTQALSQLGLALSKFADNVQEAMSQADAEILRTQDWLEERARYWHRQVVQAQQEVQLAQQALRRCQSSFERDQNGRPIPPDCSDEQAYFSACRRKLQQAEAELQTVKRWQAKIEQAIGQYHKSAKVMRDVALAGKQQGQLFLSQKIADIEKYSLTSIPVSTSSPVSQFEDFSQNLPVAHGEAFDTTFRDNRGREIVLRVEDGSVSKIEAAKAKDTEQIDHPIRLRAYDQGAEASRANLTLEISKKYNGTTEHYDTFGNIRLRVNDIETNDSYKRSGLGSILIENIEQIARVSGVREVYGILSYKGDEEVATRSFYRKNGYDFRFNLDGDEEIFKEL